jgi:hypothetical protein
VAHDVDAGWEKIVPYALHESNALEETLKRFPSWEIDTPNVERLHTSTVRGFAKLPILL